VIDRGVRLDRVVDRKSVRRLHLAVQGADDSRRHGLLEPEGAADRDNAIADDELARVAEREWEELRRRCIDLQDREIRR
jgi:hypothetical protein